jgi:hypothetical protein
VAKGKRIYGFDRLQLGQQIEMLFATPKGYHRRRMAAYEVGSARGWVIRVRKVSDTKLTVKRCV